MSHIILTVDGREVYNSTKDVSSEMVLTVDGIEVYNSTKNVSSEKVLTNVDEKITEDKLKEVIYPEVVNEYYYETDKKGNNDKFLYSKGKLTDIDTRTGYRGEGEKFYYNDYTLVNSANEVIAKVDTLFELKSRGGEKKNPKKKSQIVLNTYMMSLFKTNEKCIDKFLFLYYFL
jgi:hypothetical protein